jgi:hypothetical protein
MNEDPDDLHFIEDIEDDWPEADDLNSTPSAIPSHQQQVSMAAA